MGNTPITIEGGANGENLTDPSNGGDGDTLDLQGLENVTLSLDPLNNEQGSATYTNDAGEIVTINFTDIENILYDAPDAPSGGLTAVLINDTGASNSDGATSNLSPEISGSGGTEGDIITLFAADGTTVLGSAIVNATGDWSIDPVADYLTLGTNTLSIITTRDGLVSAATPVPVTVEADSVVDGTNGDDVIVAGYSDGVDLVDGADGNNDVILGYDGADSILAGQGNDTVDGGIDADTIAGEMGDDVIAGGSGNDLLTGGFFTPVPIGPGEGGSPLTPTVGQDDLNYNTDATGDEMGSFLLGEGFVLNSTSQQGTALQSALYTGGDLSPAVTPGNIGVILSTGNVTAFNDEDETNTFLSNGMGSAGEAKLQALAGLNTFDASVLTMNVTATQTGSATIDVSFLTDEYPDFFGDTFSDLAAIHIDSGDGSGFQLINLIGTDSGFADVNSLENDMDVLIQNGNTNDPETFNTDFNAIQNLQAVYNFTAGQSYTIEIAIADAGDAGYDSAFIVGEAAFSFDDAALDGNDTISGGAGDDTIAGGTQSDTIFGGAGDDDIILGGGDSASGDDGDDEFTIDSSLTDAGGITIVGGEAGENADSTANGSSGDILDLRGLGAVTHTPSGESGTVVYKNDDGDDVTITYSEIETVITDPVIDAADIAGLEAGSFTIAGTASDSDTVVLDDAAPLSLDFTLIDNTAVTDIERIDMTGVQDHSVTLTQQDVLDMSSTTDTLVIMGDAGDSVEASGFVDTMSDQTIQGEIYDVYALGEATLIIDQAIGNVDVT